MSKYYSVIIVSKDGEETARFDGLRAPELGRKIDAAIELGCFAVVDEGEKEEQPKYIWQEMLDPEERFVSKMIEDACLETNTSGIL